MIDTNKQQDLLRELRELLAKYGAEIVSCDEYEWEGNVCGTSYTIEGPGIRLSLKWV